MSNIRAAHRTPARPESGFLSIGGILTLLIVGAIIFVAFKLLPPYIDNYRLRDSMDSIARNATYVRATEADIRQQVLSQANDLGIDLDPSQVVVSRSGVSVDIAASYVVTVDLLVRQLDLEFTPSVGNRNIIAK